MAKQELRAKAHKIFDYLADVVKLGYKVVYDLQDHDDFLLTAAEIKEVQHLKISNEFYLPQGELLTMQRLQETPHSKEENKTAAVTANHKLFDKLFNIKQRLEYEEKTELVLGYGILLWEQEGKQLRYPLLTRNAVIEHQPKENKIRVVAPDDAQWKLEVEPLIDVGATQLAALREKFNQINSLNSTGDNPYLDLLYEATGITADGEVITSSEPAQAAITENLQIVDDWVLFMRQRKQNEVLNDIEAFKKQLADDKITLADSIKNILSDPEESNFEWEDKNFHDEWSSYLDQEILFPKPANDEQVKILDCLEQSNGVVVQGPPGTGKSHTIANLVSHFMAQGEKVLVTSQKDQALKVLTDMIPQQLQSLTMPVFQTDVHRKEKLEEVVTDISDIVSNQSYAQLKSDVEELEEQFATIKDRLEIVVDDLQELGQAELEVRTESMKYSLPPAKAAKKVAHEQEKYSWFKDEPDYEVKQQDGVVLLKSDFPLTKEELETMQQLRAELKPNLDELVQYELPDIDKLVDLQKYRIMSHQLKEARELKNKIEHDYPDLVFKVTEDEVGELLELIKETLNVYNQVSYSRSLNFIKKNQDAKEELKTAIDELGIIVEQITELQQQVGSTTKVDLDKRIKLRDYLEYVEDAIARVKESKSVISWFNLFNNAKKQALRNIRINDHEVSDLEEWIAVRDYIKLRLTIEKFIAHWQGLENSFMGQLPEFSTQVTAKIKHNYEQLQQAFLYKYELRPQLKERLDDTIIGELDVEQRDFAEQLRDLYYVFKLKEEESNLSRAQELFDSMRQELKIYQEQNGHPAVEQLIDCLNITAVEELEDKIAQWSIYYNQLQELEELKPQFKEFEELVDKLATQAPQWAEKCLDANYEVLDLDLSDWQEAWEHKVLESYLKEIISQQEKVTELETQQEEFQEQLTNLKRKLVLAKVKLKLKENTSQADINALKKWKHAVNRIGKGTGKNAAKWSKEAQKYMKKAKNAVPTWIMPLYRVSETITREMNSFDVLIIDEASQSNITALLALARAKKVIVVGDEKQISPSVVGISRDKIEVFIEQHLKDLANKNMMDLKTSLYDIAKATFDGRYNLMLKEHFRSLPEIIEFSNQNFYEGKILPLRNVREEQRLKPTLENIYLKEGEIDSKGKVNKREAEVICEKVKELSQDPMYQDKTFGVVSLKGKKQAEYIAAKIDDYLTPQEQEEHKFLAGDAYTFQGDERDVMLLSMVVASNRRFRALTRSSARQRFNVAVSRARDQVILVHSVKLEQELDNEDDMRYKLLDYIKNHQYLEQKNRSVKCETQLEKDVYQWLKAEGYNVTVKEQIGNHVLDLVVKGEQNRMAIECAGDQFYSPEQWWEDKRKQRQLIRVGWDIYNLQGASFYLNAEQCKRQLKRRIEESLN
ncbi:AAA domain-containing protein [Halanaerobacter jeridensis]|uniref:KaiC/GvpD/RAD55 family RecA-like ATPase n=1 Tax=Halanaerobacter jeridensis TaxID=706427 RepID=A0A939BRT3_9FIRM|nr:AAA domain-containing protein [Halanaerobacter jeridensis]MBM7556356.1 KaiC/GvpD/RAD55 family RecA-like ATPase [Halanaerobacter jeridensis]